MREIKVLDCTLRDGGRCFGNAWGDETIKDLSFALSKAGIDIIEIGFLWYIADGVCRENTTLFRNFYEIESFLAPKQNYVAYIEYEVFEKGVYEIVPKKESSLSGIRLGVLKNAIQKSINTMKEIVEKGYQLYVQGINILSYSDEELLSFIKIVNEINPYAFAIVDTFGSMEPKDLIEKFGLIHNNLNSNIAIALHSHNNNNLSLSLAETFINISEDRDIVIDSTLLGIGMGAGNLCTELITRHLIDTNSKSYDITILDNLIEKYIIRFREKFLWGCTPLSIDSSKTWRSQLQVSYIAARYSNLSIEQQRYLLAMCPIGRGIYLEEIDSYYRLLSADYPIKSDYLELKELFFRKKIVLVGRGPSVAAHRKQIEEFVNKHDATVIFINCFEKDILNINTKKVFRFFSHLFRYQSFIKNNLPDHVILFAGMRPQKDVENREFTIHVKECVEDFHNVYSDSIMWMLNLLCGMKNECEIFIAGFDGGYSNSLQIQMFSKYISLLRQNNMIEFLTNSVFDHVGRE